ncbi:MAG: transglutaminase-like domain-containing protein [Candidatus Hodarchaeales archaeon]|jgi:transglutaminase-like putative cysteine protease
MSSNKNFGRDPAPSAIRYLVLLSTLVSGVTALSFLPKLAGSSTAELNFYQGAIPIFTAFASVSVFEWFLLGRSRKMRGPYGFAFLVEILKTVALGVGANQYARSVEGGSTGDFLLLQLTTIAILFMLALTKFARTRIEELAQRDISRHVLNLLPTILVILLFMGTYITEIAGLGTPRQRRNFDEYSDKTIDWEMFNTPTWDATYILENLLDQFTAGLTAPDVIIFNVTSDDPTDSTEPPAYWRISNLDEYEYVNKPPYSTDWNPSTSVKRDSFTYSTSVPPSSRTASFNVEMPLDHNSTTVDVTIHPSFPNMLPTTWNGELGSYVDSNTFNLYDSNENPLSLVNPASEQAKEVFPNADPEDFFGVYANMQVAETSTEAGRFEFTMDYQAPDIQTAAAFSLTRSEADYLKCGIHPVTWESIKSRYLQVPDTVPVGFTDYADWAPLVASTALNWNDSFQTVFGQSYANMLKFGNQSDFIFDYEMWVGAQVGLMAHPAEYEDYNQWFLERGSGVSLHFASAYTMINRLQKIPSRVVIGYLAGNDSYIYGGKRAVTSRFLHAWSEVLVPIDPNPLLPGDERVEWMSFDPLLSQLAEQYGFELPTDIIPPSSAEQTTFIRADYDLETNGLAQAYVDNAIAQASGDWIFGRCTVNNSILGDGATLHDGDYIEVSTRLISIPSAATWLPYQNETVNFYIGTDSENTTGDIETTGTSIGSGQTDSAGRVTISLTIDIGTHGIRTVRFYGVVILGSSSVRRLSISFSYDITF